MTSGRRAHDGEPSTGIAEALLLPLAVFVILLAIPQPPPNKDPHFIDISKEPCFEVTIEDKCARSKIADWLDVKRRRDSVLREKMDSYVHHTCRPPILGGKADWTTKVSVNPVRSGPECHHATIRALDTVTGAFVADALDGESCHPQFNPAGVDSESRQCVFELDLESQSRFELEGAPLRTYSVAVVVEDDKGKSIIDSRPTLIHFDQKGINVRPRAMLQTLFAAIVGCALTLLLYRWRPEHPGLPRWLSRSRRWATAYLGGWGAVISATVYLLLPPDVGGRDQFNIGYFAFLPAYFTSGAIVACVLDWSAKRIGSSRGLARLGHIAVVALVIAPWFLLIQIGSAIRAEPLGHLDFQKWYYIYFALAIILPIVTIRLPKWQSNLGIGEVLPTRERALKLLGYSVLGGTIAGIVTFIAGVIVDVPHSDPFRRGFSKPASPMGFVIAAAPILYAFCLAVHFGEERPTWIQRANQLMQDLRVTLDPGERPGLARSVLGLLLKHFPYSPEEESHLEYLAPKYGLAHRFAAGAIDQRIICKQTNLDIERLRSQLELIEARFRLLSERATKNVAEAVLFVDGKSNGVLGKVVLEARKKLPPQGREYVVYHGKAVLQRDGVHYNAVRHVLETTFDRLIKEDWTGRPLDGTEITVRFDAEGFVDPRVEGSSFQLSLCLAAFRLATGKTPRFEPWIATGRLKGANLEVAKVAGIVEKLRSLDGTARLIVCSPGNLAEAGEVVSNCFEVDAPESVRAVQRRTSEALGRGESAVVGVATAALAIALIFD